MFEAELQYLISDTERRIARINVLKRRIEELDKRITATRSLLAENLAKARSGTETNYPENDDRIFYLTVKRFFLQWRLKVAERKFQKPRKRNIRRHR